MEFEGKSHRFPIHPQFVLCHIVTRQLGSESMCLGLPFRNFKLQPWHRKHVINYEIFRYPILPRAPDCHANSRGPTAVSRICFFVPCLASILRGRSQHNVVESAEPVCHQTQLSGSRQRVTLRLPHNLHGNLSEHPNPAPQGDVCTQPLLSHVKGQSLNACDAYRCCSFQFSTWGQFQRDQF